MVTEAGLSSPIGVVTVTLGVSGAFVADALATVTIESLCKLTFECTVKVMERDSPAGMDPRFHVTTSLFTLTAAGAGDAPRYVPIADRLSTIVAPSAAPNPLFVRVIT